MSNHTTIRGCNAGLDMATMLSHATQDASRAQARSDFKRSRSTGKSSVAASCASVSCMMTLKRYHAPFGLSWLSDCTAEQNRDGGNALQGQALEARASSVQCLIRGSGAKRYSILHEGDARRGDPDAAPRLAENKTLGDATRRQTAKSKRR